MSVKVMAFDVSTFTGFAFWETHRHESQITADVIELPEAKSTTVFVKGENKRSQDFKWDDWRVGQAGLKYSNVLKRFRPEIVIIEERLRFSKSGDGAFAMTNALHGALYSQCLCWGIPFGIISSQSWRLASYGVGFKQPLIPDLDRNRNQKTDEETGKPKFKKKDWGDIAVEKCEKIGINLPNRKDISHNAAEAALMCMRWRDHKKISVPSEWGQKKYLELLKRD